MASVMRLVLLVIALSSAVPVRCDVPEDCIVVIKPGERHLKNHTPKVKKTLHTKKVRIQVVEGICNEVEGDENIEHAEPNAVVQAAGLCNAQNTNNTLWGLTRISSRDLPEEWGSGQYLYGNNVMGENVDAYIVDTGVYFGHNEFGGRATYGFTAREIQCYEGDEDLNGHGTFVAAKVGGAQYGVAKHVNIVSVKVLNQTGGGTLEGILEGLTWVIEDHIDKQADPDPHKSVINMGIEGPDSYAMEKVVAEAVAAGIPVVVSAGNRFKDACHQSPGNEPTAITVAASQINDEIAWFSNYGECVNIVAPGVGITSAFASGPDASYTASGTSMSASHVTGAVARYLSTFPSGSMPTPAEVMEWLDATATVGKITFIKKEHKTVNKLLYAACAE